MNRLCAALTGFGLGAGLMYLLDPDMGRRRRALLRDKAVSLGHQASDVAAKVGRDMKNRAHGLASGDMSVLVGGKRALSHPLEGGWSPTGRTLLTALGAGVFLFGLTRSAPSACMLGTMGLAMVGEGLTNVGVSDIQDAAQGVAQEARMMMGGDNRPQTTSGNRAGMREVAAV
jgi:hypothetical protein